MSSLDDIDTGETEEEKLLEKISMLKSCLDGKLKKMPLFLDDVTPEAAEEAKQGEGMEKNLELLTKLKGHHRSLALQRQDATQSRHVIMLTALHEESITGESKELAVHQNLDMTLKGSGNQKSVEETTT